MSRRYKVLTYVCTQSILDMTRCRMVQMMGLEPENSPGIHSQFSVEGVDYQFGPG